MRILEQYFARRHQFSLTQWSHFYYFYLDCFAILVEDSDNKMFGDLNEIVEMFKHCFPLSILFFVPIMIILSPVSPTAAAHEFAAFRMQQYDLQGSSYGKHNDKHLASCK